MSKNLVDKYNNFMKAFETGLLVGIDIGLSAVKIAVLSEGRKGKFRLEKYQEYYLSEAAIIEDDVQKPDEVIQGIKKIYNDQKINKHIACIGLAGPNTVTKRLQVPDGSKEDVEDNIIWESEQYIHFGADDAEIGFSIVGKIEEEEVIDAIVGAAKIDIIENYSNLIKEAGLIPKVVDLNVFAVVNAFEFIYANRLEDLSEEGTLIIDYGAQYTTVIVYKNKATILTKEISIGGVLLTEEIQRTMGVSYAEAEDLKIHGDDNGNLPEEIIEILENHNERLLEELKKVLNFYIAAGSSQQIGNAFVTGGSCRLPGSKESLQDFIDMDVEEIDPFMALEVKGNFSEEELDDLAYCSLVAIGLAMRRI